MNVMINYAKFIALTKLQNVKHQQVLVTNIEIFKVNRDIVWLIMLTKISYQKLLLGYRHLYFTEYMQLKFWPYDEIVSWKKRKEKSLWIHIEMVINDRVTGITTQIHS